MSQRTSIFSKLVRDFASGAAVSVTPDTPLVDTVTKMAAADASSATVVDEQGRPVGILTEQDVTRRVVFQASEGQPVKDVMTRDVVTISADEYLYYAIARMRRRDLRHMPVVDSQGALAGILDLHHAVADASTELMAEIDKLTREDSVDGLTEIKAAQVGLADYLMAEGLPTTEIQALLTHINNDIYRRVIDLNLTAMEADGRGTPPANFCVIVMGSGGRGENYIYPDQDNGFIIEDYDDDRHTEIDAWFIELAERMTGDLDRVGLPLCKGYVMATNPLWRKTLSQWKEQISLWSRRRNTTALRLCDIFFDFRCVWGNPEMAIELHDYVAQVTQGNVAFLREMYEDDRDNSVALGWFGRFITEKDVEAHKGEMNLKHTGTLPLVEAIRLLSLRDGVGTASTLNRMEALRELGVLSHDEHDYLSGGFRHICRLLLRQQIADFKNGNQVSNYVDPKALTKREQDILTDSFKAIRDFRNRVGGEFTGELF